MIWLVKKIKYRFPDNWNKNKVLSFVNENYKICPFCGKFDIALNHLNECNSTFEEQEINNENIYK